MSYDSAWQPDVPAARDAGCPQATAQDDRPGDQAYTGEPMATASAVPGGSVDLALEGCTVIVTGAGSGIGAATARLLGAAGASVVLVGRREALLRQSAGAIEETGGRSEERRVGKSG